MHLTRSGLVTLMALGCGPKVATFSVTPTRACATDTVIVRASTKDEGELRIMPRRIGANADTVRYVYVASKKDKLDQRSADVLTYLRDDLDTLVFGPTGRLGTDSVRVQDTLRVEFWPEFIRIQELRSANGRPIAVSHRGKTAVIRHDQANATLAGLPVMGDWDLRAALLPGEQFASPGHSPPGSLSLQAILRCDHGAIP